MSLLCRDLPVYLFFLQLKINEVFYVNDVLVWYKKISWQYGETCDIDIIYSYLKISIFCRSLWGLWISDNSFTPAQTSQMFGMTFKTLQIFVYAWCVCANGKNQAQTVPQCRVSFIFLHNSMSCIALQLHALPENKKHNPSRLSLYAKKQRRWNYPKY